MRTLMTLIGCMAVLMANADAKKPPRIMAELKGPDTLEITAEQIEQIKAVQKALQERDTLKAKLRELYKDFEANREAVNEIYPRMSELDKILYEKGHRMKQGLKLELELKNTGSADVPFVADSDKHPSVQITVTGPDAVKLPFTGAMTEEFRMGRLMTLEGGKTLSFPIAELKHGKRNLSRWLIAQPGEYVITATYRSHASRALPYRKKMDGVISFNVTSNPIRLKVVVKDG